MIIDVDRLGQATHQQLAGDGSGGPDAGWNADSTLNANVNHIVCGCSVTLWRLSVVDCVQIFQSPSFMYQVAGKLVIFGYALGIQVSTPETAA